MAEKLKLPTLRLEPRHMYMLGVTAAIAVALLLVRFLYLPVMGRIGERLSSLHDLRVKMADVQAMTEQLSRAEAELRKAQERSLALDRRLGKHQSVAHILDALNERAKQHHVGLTTMQSKVEEGPPRTVMLGGGLMLRAIPLTLQVTGRYRQVAEFLGGLSGASFVSSVQRVTVVKPQAESAKLQADVIVAVYLTAI